MDAHPQTQQPFDQPLHGTPRPAAGRLDIQEPGDCLALLRHTFGELPRESLVVIGLLDGCTGGHMRIDLQPALRKPFASARLIADCLAGEGASPAPEAALVVLIGDGAASPAQDPVWRSCLEALQVMLDSEYCVRIVQSWFVSADHVRDPLCAGPGCCAFPGRRVQDLSIPTLGGRPRGSSQAETRPLDQAAAGFLGGARLPDPVLESLLAEARRNEDRYPARNTRRGLAAWDLALTQLSRSTDPTSPIGAAPWQGTREHARQEPNAQAQKIIDLLAPLRGGFERDLLIPLAALGLDQAMLGLGRRPGLETAALDPADARLWQDYASCFLGETERAPDWDRVDALESVLRELVPYARGVERENLLCLMAWIEWARGRGTAAGSFIDRCLQEFPDNEFSRLIERLMQLKGVCLWARVKQHSWSWSRSSASTAD